jgi:hypothetical protein
MSTGGTTTGTPLPPDLQPLYDTLAASAVQAKAADATKANTAQQLTSAQQADTQANADQLAAHQAVTAAATAFVAQIQKDYPG